MTRVLAVIALIAPAIAAAHPLGNFAVDRRAALRVAVRHVVDRALGAYPTHLLAIPPQVSRGRFRVLPGAGGTLARTTSGTRAERFHGCLADLVATQNPLAPGVVAIALLVAAVLGALHALEPGHGKSIVGAYLIGARGTAAHALVLGLVVTATHTAGVYVLGGLTLAASRWIVPERLFPWMSAASGLLVLAVGASLARSRLLAALHSHHHNDDHAHDHHRHRHHLPEGPPGWRGIVALGVSGGLLPCPSALVLMLAAIALGRIAFGLALIVAFSIGLAAVLAAVGLLFVHARRWFDRVPVGGGLVPRYAPVLAALVVSVAGLLIIAQALRQIG